MLNYANNARVPAKDLIGSHSPWCAQEYPIADISEERESPPAVQTPIIGLFAAY